MPPRRRLAARLLPARRSAFDEYALRRLILRDYLAIERTRLANERTALSYLRTTLALAAGAVTLLHFFDSTAARLTGWALLGVGALLLLFGLLRYVSVRRRVAGYARLHQPRDRPTPGAPVVADEPGAE